MQIGIVGLGRMGKNMTRRLIRGGHEVVVYNRTYEKVTHMQNEGARGASSPEELVGLLDTPRIVWLMLPAGPPVFSHVDLFSSLLTENDIIIDGGNSYYKDDIKHREYLAKKHIRYIDAGVSGGIWGLENGYCIMAGGDAAAFESIEPVLKTLAPPGGYLYCGPAGSGHFAKMVHNGIEYGMMQSYAEGFALLKNSPYCDSLPFDRLCTVWNQGSVIRSWLLELLATAFSQDGDLSGSDPWVDDSGEGRWTVQQAIDSGVPVPVIAQSLFQRFGSRGNDEFLHRVLSSLRRSFGGHVPRNE